MEGMLYKWTNYISGWQPRWFVLDGGTLSYYDSQEDAWKGCKGSIKISVCEIQDFRGMHADSESYFYYRYGTQSPPGSPPVAAIKPHKVHFCHLSYVCSAKYRTRKTTSTTSLMYCEIFALNLYPYVFALNRLNLSTI
uniref:PH domain-containing protein n=1 Tax=Sphaeramia orbicularis TaxID=375764 RepID=A0A672ZD98_9TELE